MNYKKADDERIKKNRQAVDKGREKVTKQTNDLENRTYSGKALNALSKGEYSKLKGSTYNRVPELQPNNTRPSTRYQNQNVTTTRTRQSTRDTKYDKDFDRHYGYRFGDFSGERYYDPKTETSTEYWRKDREDIKKKYGWDDKQFDLHWNAYNDEKNKKIADTEVDLAKKTAKDSSLLGTLQSFAYLPQAMIEGGATMLSNLLPKKYKAQNADDTNFTGTRVKQAARQTVKDEHIKGDSLVAKAGRVLYDIGTGIGDRAISAGVPVLGTASLGAETAARNNMQALERGADPTRAALTGLTTGVVSGAMNKVGLNKALASGTIKEAAKKEGLENLLEDVVNLGLDKAINQNKSQLDTLKDYYTSQGMDDLSAWTQVIKDTGLDLATSYGSGALFGGLMKVPSLGKTPDVPNDVPKVPELTGDPTVDNAIKQTVDAEAKIQDLQNQIPKAPETVETPTETPKSAPKTEPPSLEDNMRQLEIAKIQTELDLNSEMQEAVKTGRTKDGQMLTGITDADTELKRLAGERSRLEQRLNELTPQDVKDNADIDALTNYVNSQKNKTANESTPKNPSITSKPVDSKPIKDQLSPEDRASIFGGTRKGKRTQGLTDAVGYAKKFAGDTDEAKKLATECKKLLESYVESGDIEEYDALLHKIEDLDNLARNTKVEYKTKKGDVFTYDKYFTDFDEKGNEVPSSLLERFVYNRSLNNSVKKLQNARKAQIETTNAPVRRSHTDLIPEADLEKAVADSVASSMDPAHDIAGRYAAAYRDFDTYDYMDNVFDNDSFVESMANDIENGRDLTQYIDALGDMIDNAPDENVRANMQGLMDELTALNEGRVDGKLSPDEVSKLQDVANGKYDIPENGNEVPNVKPSEPTPPGNNPPNNNVPDVTEPPKTNLSRRYETLKNSDLFKKSKANMKALETAKEKGVFNKDIEGRQKAQDEALNDYLNDPEKARERNLNRQWDSGKDVDTSMLILKDALDKGDQAETNLTLLKQVENSKGAGRQLRAFRDYAGTKEHTLQKATEFMSDKADKVLKNKKTKDQFEAMAERIVNGDLSDLSSKLNMDEANIDNIRKAVKAGAGQADIVKMIGMYQAVGKTGISPEALKQISDIYDKIEGDKLSPNSKERADLEADAFKVLAKDIGGKRTWKEQWDAWRYLAMLGNPKTHLRNVLGNTTHYMVTEVKDNVGAVLEEALDKAAKKKGGIDRTKAILTSADDKLVKRTALDADKEAYAALNDSGNKYNVKDEINRAKDSFNNKTLSKIDEFNSSMLDKEDYSALKRKYSKSLARFLKANGADESIFDATDEASKALLDKGRAYAIDQAKQATFHEYSKLAESLTTLSNNLSNSDRIRDKAVAHGIEGLLPFKKTPINILKQGGKYSPISLAKGIYKALDSVKTGNSTASDAIEDLSAGLTGTGIMALGAFLASKGILTGSKNDNYDVDNAETAQGAQNYALKIGDESYTLDWLAPMSLPLFVGVEAFKQAQKKDQELGVNELISALTTIGDPITEMSMLQGINDTLESLSYGGLNSALGTFAATTGLGYVTQGVPTLAGQIARSMDSTRRSTYSDKKGAEKSIDKAITKVENKLPFVSTSNEPYINAKGTAEKNEGFFSTKLGGGFVPRLMDQMLSPGYYKQGTVTDVDKELNRLYESTGESPYLNVSNGKVQDVPLSKSDFTKYQTLYGQTNDKLYTDIIGSDEYKQLDDAQRLEVLKNAKKMSKMIADHEIGGRELKKSEQELYDAYKENGISSILDRLKVNAEVGSLNDKYGSNMQRDTYEKWSTDPEKIALGGPEAYAEAAPKAKELGVDVETYLKKGPAEIQREAQMKQAAIDSGFVKKDGKANNKAYEKAVSMFGNNQSKIQSYSAFHSKGYTKNAQLVPELMRNNSFTDDEKGQVIMAEHGYDYNDLGKTAQGAYDIGGAKGVYYFYLLKNLADTNGNGRVDKKEKAALMNSDNQYVTHIPDDLYYYLGGAKW